MEENSALTEADLERLREFSIRMGIDFPYDIKGRKRALTISSKRGEANNASPRLFRKSDISLQGLGEEARKRLKNFSENMGIDLNQLTQVPNEIKTDEEIANIADEITENLQEQFSEEERIALEEHNRREEEVRSKEPKTTKPEKRKVTKTKQILGQRRYTDPKKRLLLNRILLRIDYNNGAFKELEEAYQNGEITAEDIEESKNGKTRHDRSLYKEVQEYEDVIEDVKVKKGWRAFKIGMAGVLLASCIVLSNSIAKEFANKFDLPTSPTNITYEIASDEEKNSAKLLIDTVKESTDYEFANLSEEQMIDAALRMPSILKRNSADNFRAAFMNFSDQKKLDDLLLKAYGEEFNELTYNQRLDLRQLTYELLGTMGEEGLEKQKWLRSPELVEELIDKYNSREEGQGGPYANPGGVAGYGLTEEWKGGKAIIERESTGGIKVIIDTPSTLDTRVVAESTKNTEEGFEIE